MRSYKTKTSPRRLQYARFLTLVQDMLSSALEEEEEEQGLSKAEIGRRIDRDKSFITRKINNPDNMTLLTLSDFAWAMNREVDLSLPKRNVFTHGTNYIGGGEVGVAPETNPVFVVPTPVAVSAPHGKRENETA